MTPVRATTESATVMTTSARRPEEGRDMATIHFHEAMHVTPEQFIAALTDLGPGRSALCSPTVPTTT
jgi:hypothetical protein